MGNVHAFRSAGWSGVCFVIAVTVAILLVPLGIPDPSAAPADIAAFVDAHRFPLLFSAWLTFPTLGFFLWFAAGLRDFLRLAPGRQEGLPDFSWGAAILTAGAALLAGIAQSAFSYLGAAAFAANGIASLYVLFVFSAFALGLCPIAIFVFAVAHSMRRHHSAPGWLAVFGYAAAACTALGTLSIFFSNPALSPTGLLGAAIGLAPAAVWALCTAIFLIRLPVAENALDTSGAP